MREKGVCGADSASSVEMEKGGDMLISRDGWIPSHPAPALDQARL